MEALTRTDFKRFGQIYNSWMMSPKNLDVQKGVIGILSTFSKRRDGNKMMLLGGLHLRVLGELLGEC